MNTPDDTLITVYGVLFWVFFALMIAGLAAAGLMFWKFNIRQIYMIRSGRAQKKSVMRMTAKNRKTGKLREDVDLDFTSGNLGTSKKTDEEEGEELFTRDEHSGETGVFHTEVPTDMPEAQREQLEEAERRAEAMETGLLRVAEETARLDQFGEAQNIIDVSPAYLTEDDRDELMDYPPAPFRLLASELVVHTKESIDV